MVAVAALASIATSPSDIKSKDASHDGARFELNAQQPEVRIPFTMVANPQQDAEFSAFLTAVWVTDTSAVDQVLVAAVEDETGTRLAEAVGNPDVWLTCGVVCLGDLTLVVSTSSEIASGVAVVDWTARAGVVTPIDEAPEDLSLDFSIEDPDAPTEWETPVRLEIIANAAGGDVRRERLVAEVSVRDGGGNARIAFDTISARDPERGFGVLYVFQGDRIDVLEESESVPLLLPPGCDSGRCSFEIELQHVDRPPLTQSGGTWSIYVDGSGTVKADAEYTETPAVSSVTGGRERLVGDQTVTIPLRVEIDQGAVPQELLGITAPSVRLTLTPEVEAAEGGYPSNSRLAWAITIGPNRLPWEDRFAEGRFDEELPTAVALPELQCDEQTCFADFEVELATTRFQDAEITIDWKLSASLSYPLAESAPAGAELRIYGR